MKKNNQQAWVKVQNQKDSKRAGRAFGLYVKRGSRLLSFAMVPALVLSLAACTNSGEVGREVVKDSGKTITVIENNKGQAVQPTISVAKIDRYENVQVSDWLNEDTVILAKENETLEKIKLLELEGKYPHSLYTLSLASGQYELIQAKEQLLLGGATLSADKKHLLYQSYSVGDPVFHTFNLATKQEFDLTGQGIGGAMSAYWADGQSVVGAAYSGGAYIADTAGVIQQVTGLSDELLVIAQKAGNKLYYTTNADSTLKVLDLSTQKVEDTGFKQTYQVHVSPDSKQLAVIEAAGAQQQLVLADENGGNQKVLAEGAEFSGVAWSQDQRFIAYSQGADSGGRSAAGLYVYDMVTNESKQLAVDVENAVISWSPTGKALAYSEWKNDTFVSYVLHLQLSL